MNDLALNLNPGAIVDVGTESSSTAVAAQAKATVEARYTIALHRPRNWDQVRQDLLKECRRPSFANNKSAYYRKPIGNGVEGLGIRFVEVAFRCMTNVLIETTMIFEGAQKEVHRVSVTDLEYNATYSLDVKVSKTVERSKPSDDGSYISMRINSYKKPVYTVPANDDDLLNKRAALISKAMRTVGLRIVPGDLCDEAEDIIKSVRMQEAARDPEAGRKNIIDSFATLNVKVSQLVEYLGHDIGSCSPVELVNLRGLYGAIKDGEATWATVMENKAENGSDASPSVKPARKTATEAPPAPPPVTASAEPAERAPIVATPEPPENAAARETAEMVAAFGDTPKSLARETMEEVQAEHHNTQGDAEMASLGEQQHIKVKAKMANTELSALYHSLGMTHIGPEMAGMTKEDFRLLKAKLS